MTYTGYATLKPEASELRLAELSQRLERLNCSVHISQDQSKLEFELLDDESLWLTTGQLTLLFLNFKDIVSQQAHGYQDRLLQA